MNGRARRVVFASGTALLATALVCAAGCDNLARSQGKFPVVASLGEQVLGENAYPLDPALLVDDPMSPADKTRTIPLVKIGYRSPWTGRLLNDGDDRKWSRQSAYMVIDVTNLVRDPSLGSGGDVQLYRSRLRKVAELMMVAGDWNGDVYWRHLTTFLETYRAADAAARTALGAGIAASFISPVLGASIAGGGLVVDTGVTELTASLDVEQYAELRSAASTYRETIKREVFEGLRDAVPGSASLNVVLQQAYDYSFTYSIRGAVQAATKQNAELKNLLLTGESAWRPLYQQEIRRVNEARVRDGKAPADEAAKLRASWADQDRAKMVSARNENAAARETAEAELAAAEEEAANLDASSTVAWLRRQVEMLRVRQDAIKAGESGEAMPEEQQRVLLDKWQREDIEEVTRRESELRASRAAVRGRIELAERRLTAIQREASRLDTTLLGELNARKDAVVRELGRLENEEKSLSPTESSSNAAAIKAAKLQLENEKKMIEAAITAASQHTAVQLPAPVAPVRTRTADAAMAQSLERESAALADAVKQLIANLKVKVPAYAPIFAK